MSGFCVWLANKAITPDTGQQWGITPDPAIESALLPADSRFILLTPHTPLWLAEATAKRVFSGYSARHLYTERLFAIAALACRVKARSSLASLGWEGAWPTTGWQVPVEHNAIDHGKRQMLLRSLYARRLLEEETQQSLVEQGGGQLAQLRLELHSLVLAGLIERESAVGLEAFGRLRCRRCGSEQVQTSWCARCRGECPRCLECRSLGTACGCSPMYSLTAAGRASLQQQTTPISINLELPFTLSPAQKSAAVQITEAVRNSEKQVLVWAACGAGKTEVVYEAMRQTVAQSGRVLLVTPRRDVTAELCERLKNALGAANVTGLYGGAELRYAFAPIMVATTHQAIRLDGPFQLVVLDECDAFPLSTDLALQRALRRLTMGEGCFVQMSATPPAHLRQTTGWRVVHIPARHHGHPLPVPAVILDRSLAQWKSTGISTGSLPCPPTLCQAMVETRRTKAQLLVFVPTKAVAQPLVTAIRDSGITNVASVHAGSANRDTVRTAFRDGELEVVVATTVFERGLTFPQADVAVFAADTARVFDAASLVQMAGRVGRAAERPSGHVWFICERETIAVRQAISDISELNAIAAARGMLHHE